MFGAASTTAAMFLALQDTGLMLANIIPPILGGVVALLGLGYGVSRVRHYIFDEHGFSMSGGMYTDEQGGWRRSSSRW